MQLDTIHHEITMVHSLAFNWHFTHKPLSFVGVAFVILILKENNIPTVQLLIMSNCSDVDNDLSIKPSIAQHI